MKLGSMVVVAALSGVLSGCAGQPPLQRPPFPVEEYQKLVLDGAGTVSGQVFMKTVGGDVKYGAGSEVALFPVTSYSNFWYQNGYLQSKPIVPSDERQKKYMKVTQADGNGNFKFTNVAPGDYYVSSMVVWQAPTQFGLATQGGYVAKPIAVDEKTEARVMLTR
ncbi:hypothetical protein [Pseudomonas putida]|nr:hypothetical protein [Pseudomonas putida]